MGDRSEFDRWVTSVQALPRPVVTLLLAAIPAQGSSVRALAEEAFRDAGVPQEPRHALARMALERWRAGPAPTLAVGMSLSGDVEPAVMALPFAAAELADAHGARARMGEPWTTPVRLALLARPRTVVLYVDVAKARRFEAEGGVVREVADAIRPLDTSQWREMHEDQMGMPGTPARGGSGTDLYEKRVEDWTERFWARVAGDLASDLEGSPDARLFVTGTARAVAALDRAWPGSARVRPTVRPGALADPSAPTGAWADAIVGLLASEEKAREAAALRELEAGAAVGPAEVWRALTSGRLATVVLPAGREVAAARDTASQDVRDLPDGLPDALNAHGTVERIDVTDVIAPMLERHRTLVRLVRGERADELEARFRGVAGRLRG